LALKTTVKGIQLVCPNCEDHPSVLEDQENAALVCPQCNSHFTQWDSKPNFINPTSHGLDPVWEKGFTKTETMGRLFRTLNTLYQALKAPRVNFKPKPHFVLIETMAKRPGFKALFVGYNRYFEEQVSKNLVQIDVVPKQYVDVVAMGESVPFPGNSFNLVVISGVIEHTQYPFKVVNEAHRVLKPGGKLYVSSPWVYPFHGGDNYRFSHEGLKFLCHQFGDLEVGSLNGPLHALGIFLTQLVVTYLSFGNRVLRYGFSIFASWFVFPLMVIDELTIRRDRSKFILNANIYAIATKREKNANGESK